MKIDVKFSTNDRTINTSFSPKNGKIDSTFNEADSPLDASFSTQDESINTSFDQKPSDIDPEFSSAITTERGATYYPEVSEEGIISWTNDRNLDNPPPVDIRGPEGKPGDKGDKGDKGDPGELSEEDSARIDATEQATQQNAEDIQAIQNIIGASTEGEEGIIQRIDRIENDIIATMIGDYEGDDTKSIRSIAAEEINRLIKASDDEGGEIIENIGNLVDYVEQNAGNITALIVQTGNNSAKLAGIDDTVVSFVQAEMKKFSYELPVATATILGGIRSAEEQNGVSLANQIYVNQSTGVAEIRSFSTDNLVQGSKTLILSSEND